MSDGRVDPTMAEDGVLGADPAIRVAFGGSNRSAGRKLLSAAREVASGTAVAEVGSTGVPELEALVLATTNGETAFFPECSTEQAESIAETLEAGSLPREGARWVVEHESGTKQLPTPAEGPLSVGTRRVLGACGWAMPTSPEDYPSGTVLANEDRGEDDLTRVGEAGLRGRGRGDAAADAPIAERWERARDATGEPAIVINANEADSHAVMDRLLVESTPLAVLDAALAAGRALDATNVLVYCNEADELAQRRAARAASVLEERVSESPSIEVLAGPDEYKAGEPTMALEALEGNHRLEARLRPPYPSEEGLYGRPTLVHTPRTLAQVGTCLADDEAGADSGTRGYADRRTRLFSVVADGSGDEESSTPATVELGAQEDLTAVQEAAAFDGHLKAACVGGVFGGLTRTLDVPARANALAGAGLGTNGVIELFGEDECMVAFAGNRAVFGEEENCGRCVPCREGTQQLTGLLRDVYHGEYASGKIRELLRVMGETSICSFGQDAPRPVRTAMAEFEVEFRAHANGRCPAGVCR